MRLVLLTGIWALTAAAGPAADADGDGVPDPDDHCPLLAGEAALQGCPDRDRDGVADAEDVCPDLRGPVHVGGCPDRDDDGVADLTDACPEVLGVAEARGCLPPSLKRFLGRLDGVRFASDRPRFKKSSYPKLDEAVRVLQSFPGMRVRIEGHTDSLGAARFNRRLSQARADAVRAYLIDKGIAPERLVAVGLGESRPVTKNDTPARRAHNRRIELRIIGHTR